MGCVMIVIALLISTLATGALTWVAFWLLNMVFVSVPVLTFGEAIIAGIALSIIGGFFHSSGNR